MVCSHNKLHMTVLFILPCESFQNQSGPTIRRRFAIFKIFFFGGGMREIRLAPKTKVDKA